MDAFDPSGSTYTCKKAYVTATDEHYRWDGSAWVLESADVENIYNTSDTLTASRKVTLADFNLDFDLTGTGNFSILDSNSTVFKITDAGRIGLWTASPGNALHAVNNTNINAFNFVSNNGLTSEKDVFTIEDKDVGSGGQDHSSVLKLWKSADINANDFGFSLAELTYTGADPGNGKHWISGRKTNESTPEWGVNISDNQIWSSGGILLNATGSTTGEYSGGNFIVETDGDVGIGTNAPATRLEVDGSVRFADHGTGTTYLDTASSTTPAEIDYVLGVDSEGDVLEMNTAKSSKIFYPPAIVIDASATGTGFTLNLHKKYMDLYATPAIVSSGAPTAIPYYAKDELYYYITDYDMDVFKNVSIDIDGILSYDINQTPVDNCSVFNVVFVVR